MTEDEVRRRAFAMPLTNPGSTTATSGWPRAPWASSTSNSSRPNYLLKIIPHVDGTLRVCELVRYC